MAANSARSGLRIGLMGGFSLVVDGEPVALGWRLRKAETLVKLLAMHRSHQLHRDQLMEWLWPDLGADAAAGQLRKALHVARRALDADAISRFIVRRGEVLALRPGIVTVDIDEFEKSAETARRERTVSAYEAAIEAYTGEFLPEDRYEDWAADSRRQLKEKFADLLLELAGLLEAQGDLNDASARLEAVAAIRPFDESVASTLMRVYALAGRRGAALDVFARLSRALNDALEVSPGPEVESLHEEIRTGETIDPDLNRRLWERVGDLRLVAGDLGGAERAFDQALPKSARVTEADRSRLHRKMAQALIGQHQAEQALNRLDGIDSDSIGPDEEARVAAVRANSLAELGRLEEAVAAAARSVEAAERGNDLDAVAGAHEAVAIVSHYGGSWRDGLHGVIERLGETDAAEGLGRVFDIHHCIGQYHLYGDELSHEVEGYARRTLDLAVEKGARRAQAFAWCLLGEWLLLRGRWDEAAGCLRRSGEIHAELGHISGGLAWQRLAELEVYRGESERARSYLERAMSIASVSPMASHLWGRIYATAALDALERDDSESGVRALRAAARAAAAHGECPSCSALLHPIAAEAYCLLDDAEAAGRHAEAASRVAAMSNSPAWEAMAATAAGFSAKARSDPEGDREHFLRAADLYHQGEQPFWEARSRMQAAQADPEHAQAPDLLQSAAAGFDNLGAVRASRRASAGLPVGGR